MMQMSILIIRWQDYDFVSEDGIHLAIDANETYADMVNSALATIQLD